MFTPNLVGQSPLPQKRAPHEAHSASPKDRHPNRKGSTGNKMTSTMESSSPSRSSGRGASSMSTSSLFTEFFSLNRTDAICDSGSKNQHVVNPFPFAVAIEAYGVFQQSILQLRVELGPACTTINGNKSEPLAAARLSKGGAGELQLLNCNLMGVGSGSPVSARSPALAAAASPQQPINILVSKECSPVAENDQSPNIGNANASSECPPHVSARNQSRIEEPTTLASYLPPTMMMVGSPFGSEADTSGTATGHNTTIGSYAPMGPLNGTSLPIGTSTTANSNTSATSTGPNRSAVTATPGQDGAPSPTSTTDITVNMMSSFLMSSNATNEGTPKLANNKPSLAGMFLPRASAVATGFMMSSVDSGGKTANSSPFGMLTGLPTVLSTDINKKPTMMANNGSLPALATFSPSTMLANSFPVDTTPINTMAAAAAATSAMFENAPESIQIKKLRSFIERLSEVANDEASLWTASNPFGSTLATQANLLSSSSPCARPSLPPRQPSRAVSVPASAQPSKGADSTSMATFKTIATAPSDGDNVSGISMLHNNLYGSFDRKANTTSTNMTQHGSANHLNSAGSGFTETQGTATNPSTSQGTNKYNASGKGLVQAKVDVTRRLYTLARRTISSPALLPVAAYAIAARSTVHFHRIRQMLLLWCDSAIETAGLIIPNKASVSTRTTPTSSSDSLMSKALIGIAAVGQAPKADSTNQSNDTPMSAVQLGSKSESKSWGLESDPEFVAMSNGANPPFACAQPCANSTPSTAGGDSLLFAGSCAFGNSGMAPQQGQVSDPPAAAAESMMLPSGDDPFGGASLLEDSKRDESPITSLGPRKKESNCHVAFLNPKPPPLMGAPSEAEVILSGDGSTKAHQKRGRHNGRMTPISSVDLRTILLDILEQNTLPPRHVCERIIVESRELMRRTEANVVTLSSPCVVVGDIHGNMDDLRAIVRKSGGISGVWTDPTKAKNESPRFLFLGDYVDRGSSSLHVALSVCCAKLLCPDSVFLIRGNHESKDINATYGFLLEVDAAFPTEKHGPNPSYAVSSQRIGPNGSLPNTPHKLTCASGGSVSCDSPARPVTGLGTSPLGPSFSRSKADLLRGDSMRKINPSEGSNPLQVPGVQVARSYCHIRPLARYKESSRPPHRPLNHHREVSNTTPSRFKVARPREHKHVRLAFATESENEASQSDNALWALFNDMFRAIPLAALVDNNIFCVHGGLSPSFQYIEAILAVDRFLADKNDLIMDLLWSDPSPHAGYATNRRGNGCLFGPDVTRNFIKKNNLRFICRAHQCVKEGYQWDHGDRVLTLFSAANYCNMENRGAIMFINPVSPSLSMGDESATDDAGVSCKTKGTQASDDAFGEDSVFVSQQDGPATIEGYNTPRKKAPEVNDTSILAGLDNGSSSASMSNTAASGHRRNPSESSMFGSMSSGSRSAEGAPETDDDRGVTCTDLGAASQLKKPTAGLPRATSDNLTEPFDGIRFLTYDQSDIAGWVGDKHLAGTITKPPPNLLKVPVHFF